MLGESSAGAGPSGESDLSKDARISIAAILLLGLGVRLGYWLINPPNNAYDDHLEVIAWFARSWHPPSASECWQCYQPPLYHIISAVTLTISHWLSGSPWLSWKAVQLQSVLLSVAHLAVTFKIIERLGPRDWRARAFALFALALLPRDTYTAAFVSNDILLEISVGLSILVFSRYSRTLAQNPGHAMLLGLAVTLASLTKQSGLLTLVLIGGMFAPLWSSEQRARGLNSKCVWVAVIVVCCALSSEAIQTWSTGKFLVSNQHFFDWVREQPPGSVSQVAFFDLRLISLFRDPWMGPSTYASLPTEVFARFVSDYEPKLMLGTGETLLAARLGIASGLALLLMLAHGAALWARQARSRLHELPLMVMFCLFILLPALQTIRFPHYSSMKAVFILPSISIAMALISLSAARMRAFKAGRVTLTLIAIAMLGSAAFGLIAAATSIGEALLQNPPPPLPEF